MFKSYNFFNIFTLPIFCFYCLGKGWEFALIAFALAFIFHPLFDYLTTKYLKNVFEKLHGGESGHWSYQLPLFLAVPIQVILILAAFKYATFSTSEAIFAGTLCGLSGGILGITTAHEMMHRRQKWKRKYSMAMLYTINYPHFYIEHMWHHISIGTPRDPDTAKRSESVYSFLLRSIPQGWIKCWTSEARKLKSKSLIQSLLKNKMVTTSFIQICIHIAIYLLFGIEATVIFMVQGIVTILLLKWINYVEHYGVVRKKINGKLEPVSVHHSWDSTRMLTNFSLFNLGYHSQHHSRPSLDYNELPKTQKNWNELPAGYSTMMMLALMPYFWKRVMNKRLDLLQDQVYV